MTEPTTGNDSRVFITTQRVGVHAGIALAIGCISGLFWLLVILLMFTTSAEKHSSTMPGVMGGMCVIPIFAFGYAILMLRSVVRVELSTTGLVLHGLASRREVLWKDVVSLKREKTQVIWNQKKLDVLVLCDGNGKKLASINSIINDFPGLVEAVETESSKAQGKLTYDHDREIDRKLKEKKRNQKVVQCLFGFFVVMGIAMACWGAYDFYYERQLEADGVQANATIVKHYVYNVTPRLEYSFQDANGNSYSNDVMVKQAYWNTLKGAKAVPIIYLPPAPEWNRLQTGEIAATEGGAMMLLLGLACTVLFGIFFVIAMLGIDLETVNGKIKVVKVNQVSDALETPEAEPIRRKRPPKPKAIPDTQRDQTPKGLIALSLISVLFGGFVFLINLGRILIAILNQDWLLVCVGVVLLVAAATMAIAAWGLFKLYSWGRTASLWSAGTMLLMGAVARALGVMEFLGRLKEAPADQKDLLVIMFVFALVLTLTGFIYPIVLISVLLGKGVSRRFAADRVQTGQDGDDGIDE